MSVHTCLVIKVLENGFAGNNFSDGAFIPRFVGVQQRLSCKGVRAAAEGINPKSVLYTDSHAEAVLLQAASCGQDHLPAFGATIASQVQLRAFKQEPILRSQHCPAALSISSMFYELHLLMRTPPQATLLQGHQSRS